MRILHCSDFHGNMHWFDWLVDQSANYDLVCLTGDHLDLSDHDQLGDQLRIVSNTLRQITTPLALCSGNHDSFSGGPSVDPRLFQSKWLKELGRPGVWVDGDQFVHSGHSFRCIGWNAPFPPADREEIWLFHAPPARSPVSRGSDESDTGDEILRELCHSGNGPALVLSGHQHNPRQWICRVGRTCCINPGYSRYATTPNHIVIDTSARTATLNVIGHEGRPFTFTNAQEFCL